MAARRAETRTGGRAATTGTIAGDFALSVGMPERPAPEGWRWTKITDVARLETGHTPSRKHPEYWGGDVPWIGIRDATGNHGQTIYDTLQHTNELGIANSSARILPENTVCLSRTASVGYVVVMGRPMATSQDFVNWVCSSELDYRFLKYVLLSEQSAFLRFASGTTHQTIYFPEVKAFHVCLPSPAEQGAIGHILQTLDDKIEVNRRMSATLESMARALFKSWFVDFEPVRAKAAGRDPSLPSHLSALFPDRLTEVEYGEVPEGWEVKPLSEVAEFLNGLALQKYPASDLDDSLPVIKIAELRNGVTAKSDRASRDVPGKYFVKDGDFLFSWSGSLLAKFWTEGDGALNQHLFKVTSDRYPNWFFAEWVQVHLEEFQRIAAFKATTMGHIQRGHLQAAMTNCPPDDVLAALGHTISPLVERGIQVDLESRTLAAIRDTLLPQLISGNLRVRDAETYLDRVL